MAKHDPAARRAAMVQAAADLILEVGPAKLTHRLVAARAGVPLGSTTAYFSSLDDLRTAALRLLTDEIDVELARVREEFAADPERAPARLVDALYEHLADRRNVVADVALTATATFDDQVRDLALAWTDGLIDALTAPLGVDAARAVAMITDGACVHAAIRGEPLGRTELHRALAPFIATPGVES